MDFIDPISSLEFNPQNMNSPLCRVYAALEDSLVEGDETFSVSLTSIDSAAVIVNDTASVTILDNDGKWYGVLSISFQFMTW